MKKLFLFFIVICFTINSYAADNNLYEVFKEKPEIKIHLKEIINESKNPEIEIDIFKKIFKETIEKRRNIKFIYVENIDDADIIIHSKIKQYVFTKKALPMFFSAAALAADMTAPKSEGKLIVDYEIIEPDSGKTLLVYKNFTTSIRKPIDDMKDQEGYVNAIIKNVNRFVYRAFYKQKRNR